MELSALDRLVAAWKGKQGRRCARFAAILLVALVPSACADMDPAYNPIEWGQSIGRGVSRAFGGEPVPEPPRVEPPPAEGRPYPNLATVPRPPQVEPASNREAELKQLTADRDAAIKSDEALRAIPATRSIPPAKPRQPPGPAASAPPPPTAPAQAEPEAAAPHESPKAPQTAAVAPRPELPPSLFMGTVTVQGDAGSLAGFQQKIIEDAAAMAVRNKARIRLVGGTSAEDRQRLVAEFVRLGVPANRITAAPQEPAPASTPPRPTVDVFVDY